MILEPYIIKFIIISYIYKAACTFDTLFEWISHWFIVNLDFQLTVTHSFDIFHTFLTSNGRNLKMEHTWFILVSKCSLFYLKWDQNNTWHLTSPSKCLISARWVTIYYLFPLRSWYDYFHKSLLTFSAEREIGSGKAEEGLETRRVDSRPGR